MTPNKRSVPSSANPKKLMRPQRTQQSKNAVELASADLYNIDSDAPTDVNRDNNAAGSPSLRGATLCILEHSDYTLPLEPSKVTMSLELRVQIFALKHWRGLLQRTFLSGDKNPKEEDMQAISGHLYHMEDSTDLQSDVIRETKIRRALIEVLKLEIVSSGSKLQFKSRLKRLLNRCNKVLECKKIMAENTEKSANENGYSTAVTKGSTLDTRTIPYSHSLSLKVADNSQPKRKRQIRDHVIGRNKRLRKTPTVIVVDSEGEDEISQDSSQDQSHQDESRQSDTSQHGTLQDGAPRPCRTQRKSIIDKFLNSVSDSFLVEKIKGSLYDRNYISECNSEVSHSVTVPTSLSECSLGCQHTADTNCII